MDGASEQPGWLPLLISSIGAFMFNSKRRLGWRRWVLAMTRWRNWLDVIGIRWSLDWCESKASSRPMEQDYLAVWGSSNMPVLITALQVGR